jgi:thiol-disulfide isomerase/thioredoxin
MRLNSIIVLCQLSVVLGGDDPTEWAKGTSVTHIGHSDVLKEKLDKDKPSLVLYYLPKCKHCQMAKPFYIASTKIYNKDASFFAVNCVKSGLCAKFGVQSYPSLRLYTDPSKKYGAKGPGNAGVHRTGRFLQNKGGIEFTPERQKAAANADGRLRKEFLDMTDQSADRLYWIKDTSIKSYSALEEVDADRKKGPVIIMLEVLVNGGIPSENCRRGHKFFKRAALISGDVVHFATICCSTHFKLCRALDPDGQIGSNNFPFMMLEGPDGRSGIIQFEKGDTVAMLLRDMHSHFKIDLSDERKKAAVAADLDTHLSQADIEAAAAAEAAAVAETDAEVKAAEEKKAAAEAAVAEAAAKAAAEAKAGAEAKAAAAAKAAAEAAAAEAAKPKKKRKKKKKVKLEL